MKKLNVRKEIKQLRAYEAEDSAARIKLDANENPYDLPVDLKKAILRSAETLAFNRYPDLSARRLREAIARMNGVPVEQVLIGNGSDDILQMLVTAYGAPKGRVVFPVPTFDIYRVLTEAAGMKPVRVPLLPETFDLDIKRMLKEVKNPGTKLTFLATPNNPTGNCFDEAGLRQILGAGRGVIVMDEAYFEFCQKTCLPLLAENPNLIILRTFSKAFGLAGMRVGYAMASPELLENCWKVKLPYNVNAFSQAAALETVRAKRILLDKVAELVRERERLRRSLAEMPGVIPFRSDANFILFRAAQASAIFEKLKQKGILIRNLDSPGALENCLRVTVGKPRENEEFLSELKFILQKGVGR